MYDVRKISFFLPPCHCHKSADFVPFICFLETPSPTHCGRHTWKPPYRLDISSCTSPDFPSAVWTNLSSVVRLFSSDWDVRPESRGNGLKSINIIASIFAAVKKSRKFSTEKCALTQPTTLGRRWANFLRACSYHVEGELAATGKVLVNNGIFGVKSWLSNIR